MNSTHTMSMEVILGIPPLRLRLDYLVEKFMLKSIIVGKPIMESVAHLHRINPHNRLSLVYGYLKQVHEFWPGQPGFREFPLVTHIHKPDVSFSMKQKLHGIEKEHYRYVADAMCREVIGEYLEIFYTDGSKTDTGLGAGLVSGHGLERSEGMWLHGSVFSAEAAAILMACEEIVNCEPGRYVIATDSESVLKALLSPKLDACGHSLIWQCKDALELLDENHFDVTLVWVPSHCGVRGNEKADERAREGTGRAPERFSLPVGRDLINMPKKTLIVGWQRQWTEDELGRFTHSIMPKVSYKPYLLHTKLSRSQWTVLGRLLSNHYRRHSHLQRINIVDDALCVCGHNYETPDHMLWECTRYPRQQYTDALERLGISGGTPIRDILAVGGIQAMTVVADFFLSIPEKM